MVPYPFYNGTSSGRIKSRIVYINGRPVTEYYWYEEIYYYSGPVTGESSDTIEKEEVPIKKPHHQFVSSRINRKGFRINKKGLK